MVSGDRQRYLCYLLRVWTVDRNGSRIWRASLRELDHRRTPGIRRPGRPLSYITGVTSGGLDEGGSHRLHPVWSRKTGVTRRSSDEQEKAFDRRVYERLACSRLADVRVQSDRGSSNTDNASAYGPAGADGNGGPDGDLGTHGLSGARGVGLCRDW